MKVICINGIRTDGSSSTKLFAAKLREMGIEAIEVDYPEVGIFGARSRKRQRKNAQYLLDVMEDGDILVAHSYGCLVGFRSMEMGAKYSKVFLYAPAMNRDFTFPFEGAEHSKGSITIIHNPSDKAIKMGTWLRFRHDFGAMGSLGYNGSDDYRIINRLDNTGVEDKRNHSHYFNEKNLDNEIELFIEAIRG